MLEITKWDMSCAFILCSFYLMVLSGGKMCRIERQDELHELYRMQRKVVAAVYCIISVYALKNRGKQ
jgi:hypothetical protein